MNCQYQRVTLQSQSLKISYRERMQENLVVLVEEAEEKQVDTNLAARRNSNWSSYRTRPL